MGLKTIAIAILFAGIAAPQSQAAPAASKPSAIEMIRHPGQQFAQFIPPRNCHQVCTRIGNQTVCNTQCY